MNFELIVFDMDGTLVEEKSCWEVIHRHFDVQKEASENWKAWKNNEIDYLEFMRRDIALWNPTPNISLIKEVLSGYSLPPKAPAIMDEILSMGYETAIVSGGLDILAEMVAEELQIQHVFANGLEVDSDGYLTGEGILRVDPDCKSETLKELLRELDVSPTRCITVGDSISDADLFSTSGMGIAIGECPSTADSADVVIEDFENFGQILNYL